MRAIVLAGPLLVASLLPAAADDWRVIRGRAFATENCSRCHSVGLTGRSPLLVAPPFRELHKRYPVESLEEPLAEGIITGHPSMPEFRLPPDEIQNFIIYLKSLNR